MELRSRVPRAGLLLVYEACCVVAMLTNAIGLIFLGDVAHAKDVSQHDEQGFPARYRHIEIVVLIHYSPSRR